MMADFQLRWGIFSAAKISYDFIKSLKSYDAKHHQVVAIASQNSPERAKQFAKEFNIPAVHQTYAQVLQDKNVNVIYIGTINPYHFEAVKMALLHKIPVLCEKPLILQ